MPKAFFVCVCLFLGISLAVNGILVYKLQERLTPIPYKGSDYPLLASFVENVPQRDRLINFYPLRSDLNNYLATQSSTLGLYFEYIPTGISIGINQNQPYLYASLLKLPVVMAAYAARNRGSINFDDKKTITPEMINTISGDLWKRGAGTTITIKGAIDKSLIESDNTAYNLLTSTLSVDEFQRVFDTLDIPMNPDATQAAVTPRNYTSILKSLLYSSYLPPEDSQEILRLLGQATFIEGIRKPIPTELAVSHKFGVRNDPPYLSDCGIIYHPNRPYFLCIMEKSTDIENAKILMQTISEKIYQYIASKN